MSTVIIRRILRGLLTLAIVTIVIFFLLRIVPGDAAVMLAGEEATEEQVQELREFWGLNKPIGEQFIIYVEKLLSGDAGQSYQYTANGKPIYDATELVLMRLPNTLMLGFAAMLIALCVAIPLGVITAIKPGSALDNLVMSWTFTLTSFPVFFIGILFIFFLSLLIPLLPTGGSGGIKNIILPALTLSAHTAARLTRITRTEVGRILQSDFIRTCRAKGLTGKTVLFRHGLRNTLIPLVTVIGLQLGSLLHGAVIVETIFRWPGLGNLLITSLNARDYPVVQVLVPYTALLFIIMNIIVDIMYSFLDPRIRKA